MWTSVIGLNPILSKINGIIYKVLNIHNLKRLNELTNEIFNQIIENPTTCVLIF